MSIVLTILILLGTAIAGILIGMWLSQTIAEKADKIVKFNKEGDDEWEGVIKMDYKHLCYSLDPELQAAYKYGMYRGMKEYLNLAWNGTTPLETKDNPTPQEFLQNFEEFINECQTLQDNFSEEMSEYDEGYEAGWLAAEKELKSRYEITPRINPEDIVTAVREIDKIQTEEN